MLFLALYGLLESKLQGLPAPFPVGSFLRKEGAPDHWFGALF